MPTVTEVSRWLAGHAVQVLTFSEGTPTAETAALAVGCLPAEIAKSILFLIGENPVLVVTSGDRKIRSGLLKQVTGLSGKVRFPRPDEVLHHTGYAPGGVCPFLLPPGLKVICDLSLWRFPLVYPAAGDDHSAVPLAPQRLFELIGGERAEVCGPLTANQN